MNELCTDYVWIKYEWGMECGLCMNYVAYTWSL